MKNNNKKVWQFLGFLLTLILLSFIIVSIIGWVHLTKLIFNTEPDLNQEYCILLSKRQMMLMRISIVVVWISLILNVLSSNPVIMSSSLLAIVGLTVFTHLPFKQSEGGDSYCVRLNEGQLTQAKISIILVWFNLILSVLGSLILIFAYLFMSYKNYQNYNEHPLVKSPMMKLSDVTGSLLTQRVKQGKGSLYATLKSS